MTEQLQNALNNAIYEYALGYFDNNEATARAISHAFPAGANFYRNSIWHKMDCEEPESDKYLLVMWSHPLIESKYFYDTVYFNKDENKFIVKGDEYILVNFVKYWAYIEDLMPDNFNKNKNNKMVDYEKKYNDALAIMKEYMGSGNAGVIAENVILKAFPELAKPTEERIKNMLSNLIKMHSDIIGEDLKMNMLEWIKKASVNNNVQKHGPKFRIHDKIRSKNPNDTDIIIITSITEKGYNYDYVNNIGGGFFTFLMEDNYELVDRIL